jgi:hypothetical protein
MFRNLIRNKCSICDGDLKYLLSLKRYPVYMGASDDKKFLFRDQIWYNCSTCGCVQLKKLLPLKLVYKKFHHEIVGNIWKKHHEEFKKFLLKYTSDKVLEIGGSDGYLAEICSKSKIIKKWLIIEPNIPNKKKYNKKIKYINSYIENFNINKFLNRTIIHSHTLEHFYQPADILKKISNLQNLGEKMIFSLPNLGRYIKKKFINTIDFEHTLLLTECILDILLKNNKFRIVKKKYFLDHSIFYCVEKQNKNTNIKYLKYFKKYKCLFSDFIKYYRNKVLTINKKLDKLEKKVFLFGASQFSQYLLYHGLNQKKIIYILDNSNTKNNKYIYGYNFKIKKPGIIKKYANPIVILVAGNYQKEITAQLKKINNKVRIIE